MLKIDNWVNRNDKLKEMKKERETELTDKRNRRLDIVYNQNYEILKKKEIQWEERERREREEMERKYD